MAKNRISRVNALMKKELGQILLREIEAPEGVFMTLTRVDASPNLQQAKVYISVMPEDKAGAVLKALHRNIYDIQQVLNGRLKMRPVPRIQWVVEKATVEAQKIEELLDQLNKER